MSQPITRYELRDGKYRVVKPALTHQQQRRASGKPAPRPVGPCPRCGWWQSRAFDHYCPDRDPRGAVCGACGHYEWVHDPCRCGCDGYVPWLPGMPKPEGVR